MLYVTCYFVFLPLLFDGVEGLVGENVDGAEKEDDEDEEEEKDEEEEEDEEEEDEEEDVLPLSDGNRFRITSNSSIIFTSFLQSLFKLGNKSIISTQFFTVSISS